MQQKFELPPNKGYLKCCKTSRWKLWEQREQRQTKASSHSIVSNSPRVKSRLLTDRRLMKVHSYICCFQLTKSSRLQKQSGFHRENSTWTKQLNSADALTIQLLQEEEGTVMMHAWLLHTPTLLNISLVPLTLPSHSPSPSFSVPSVCSSLYPLRTESAEVLIQSSLLLLSHAACMIFCCTCIQEWAQELQQFTVKTE